MKSKTILLWASILSALAIGTARAQVTELVAGWDFERVEADGITIKSVVGNYAGTISGSAVLTDGSGGRPKGGGKGFDISANNPGWLLLEAGGLGEGDSNPMTKAAANDSMTVTMWQKNNANINSSSFWAIGPGFDRAFQFHIPWSDGTIYFDTSGGCCAVPTQRLSRNVVSAIPDFDWTGWHHYAFVKNEGYKAIYIDGVLFHSQDEGAAPLPTEYTQLTIGGANNGSPPDAVIDDVAIFKGALTEAQIKALADGGSPFTPPADTDNDGIPDNWETFYGFNPNSAADAALDPDGDGCDNLCEYKAGSNPTDTTKPTIVSVATSSDFKTITITFSEEVDPATATATANYTISPALAVSNISYKKRVATLTTAAQAPGGTAYTIGVKGVKDTSKNEIAADTKAVAYSYVMTKAGLLRFAWWAVDTAMFPDDEAGSLNGASPIETLLDHPRYIANQPNQVLALSSFNSRDAFPTDAKENYGATIEGLITPTESGSYRFFIHSDDSSRLWLSTDATEANLAQIAEETGCCGTFAEPGVTKTSEPIPLVAGRSYFIRLAYKEGGGGDYGRVAWRKEGDTTPAASLVPIPGKFLSSAVDLPVHPDGTFGTISPAARSRTAGPLPVITIVHTDGKTPWTSANVSLRFDGASVSPTFVKESATATITYTPSNVLPARSVHTVALTYPDPGGNPTVLEWSFEVANYTTLSTAIGTKPGSGRDAGFRIRTVQKETGRGNTDADAERQLRDNFGEADIAEVGPNAGYFHHADVINFNQDAPSAVGNFSSGNGFEDLPVYGLSGNTDNFTQEILTYLDLPAGVITMGVNSDDGFNVKPVTKADPAVAPLGIFNGGRGAADTIFSFVVPVAGVYPMRMIWYEGGGGANAEWFTVSATGAKLLINSSAAGAIKAFRSRDETQKLPSEGGKLSIAREGANLRITFTGRLQSATSVTGPYTDVAGATSPHPVTPSDTARFYRSAE